VKKISLTQLGISIPHVSYSTSQRSEICDKKVSVQAEIPNKRWSDKSPKALEA
jgi:hypothetical protein